MYTILIYCTVCRIAHEEYFWSAQAKINLNANLHNSLKWTQYKYTIFPWILHLLRNHCMLYYIFTKCFSLQLQTSCRWSASVRVNAAGLASDLHFSRYRPNPFLCSFHRNLNRFSLWQAQLRFGQCQSGETLRCSRVMCFASGFVHIGHSWHVV